MDLYKGMGFELELPDAETVEWSSGVSMLKEEARNKKSNKKNARECKMAEVKQAEWEGEASAWNAVSSKKHREREACSF